MRRPARCAVQRGEHFEALPGQAMIFLVLLAASWDILILRQIPKIIGGRAVRVGPKVVNTIQREHPDVFPHLPFAICALGNGFRWLPGQVMVLDGYRVRPERLKLSGMATGSGLKD